MIERATAGEIPSESLGSGIGPPRDSAVWRGRRGFGVARRRPPLAPLPLDVLVERRRWATYTSTTTGKTMGRRFVCS